MNTAGAVGSPHGVPSALEGAHPVWCDPRYCTVRSNLIDAKGRMGVQQGYHRARLNRRTTLNSMGLELAVGHQAAADRSYAREIWVQLSSVEQSIELSLTPSEAFRFAAAVVDAVDSRTPDEPSGKEPNSEDDGLSVSILAAQVHNAAAALAEYSSRYTEPGGEEAGARIRRQLIATLQHLQLAVSAATT
jgi:hypothetical protein